MHHMLGGVFDFDRFERARADMKQNFRARRTTCRDPI